MDLKALTNVNWSAVRKLFSANAASSLDSFLEELPKSANKSLIVIVSTIWVCAAVLCLFAMVKMQEFSKISVAHQETKALLPKVPSITDQPISAASIKNFVDQIQNIYKGLEIKENGSNIIIRARSISQYGEFREAVGHVQNGGAGWRVNVDRLCLGKECQQYPLAASLKINKVSVQ